MAYIDNSETAKELNDAIRGNANTNLPPKILANQIIPVIDINPKHGRRANIVAGTVKTTSGSQTVYTTPANKDFYLTTVSYALIKDVACDMATGFSTITCTVDGASSNLIVQPIITLTAQNQVITISFPNPIKVDRNTLISFGGTYAAGVCVRSASITGYTVEP